MENYKKKYEDSLERCKKEFNFNNLAYSHEEIKQKLEHVFPELKESEDERIRRGLIAKLSQDKELHHKEIAWLEKQSKQEQLYIRFGEIPTDEKSKIYQGEIEVGTENGVSVYPAFKTDEGDIVLGLSLPITKTTLYTQQHLLEYDDRPCYLVKGDYVGKDTDGQPLINNISIVEKINGYRVKEEKQNKQNPANKVEPKFKVGDWITDGTSTFQIVKREDEWYIADDGDKVFFNIIDQYYHLWTIKDAKDGDVLATHLSPEGDWIGIYKESVDILGFKTYCFLNGVGEFVINPNRCKNHGTHGLHPATKEQCDLLFSKMKEAGYEWDAEKKELKKIEQKSTECIQWTGKNLKEVIDFTGKSARFDEWFKSWDEYEAYVHSHGDIFKLFCADGSHYEVPVGAWIVKTPDGYNIPSSFRFIPKLAERNKEDEEIRKAITALIEFGLEDKSAIAPGYDLTKEQAIAWLKKQGEKTNPYSGISFEYNGHIWGMCARDNGIDILLDKQLFKHLERQGEQVSNEPNWIHHKVNLSNCSEEYIKAYYDGWNNCNQQYSQFEAEQKPVWNKEDEDMFNDIIMCLDGNFKSDKDMINWIKSIKNRYTRKSDKE